MTMSKLSTLQPGKLEWTGEHWVVMLRPDGSDADSAIVSHFAIRVGPGGEGNVAIVRIGGDDGIHAVCTDNPDAAAFALPRFFHRLAYYDESMPTIRCSFTRTGDATRNPGWRIETNQGRIIETKWIVSDQPIVLNSPWRDGKHVFSILYFTEEATVTLDGVVISGKTYPRDIWRDSIGGDRSSCVFALSESFFDLDETEVSR